MSEFPLNLKPNLTPGAVIEPSSQDAWRLAIPSGQSGRYRLAQLDNYGGLPRRSFPLNPPVCITLRARASSAEIPGTWGFGLWNDPFGMGALSGGGLRLPGLPQAAWFFFASPPSYLSLRDDLPAQGWLASVFRSPSWPALLLAPAALAAPLLLLPPAARFARRLGRRLVRQEAAALPVDPTGWHTYDLDWDPNEVHFRVDEETVFMSDLSPLGPLGLVLWVDNQYLALAPDGRLRYGMLPASEPAWIEIADLSVE